MAKKTTKKKAAPKTSSPKKATGKPEKQKVIVAAEDLPRRSIEDALRVVEAIHRNYANNPVSWAEIAKLLNVNPKHSMNRYPLWSAVAYGMLTKTEDDNYELAETGRKIVAPEYAGDDREGKIKALLTPTILSKFFTDFNGHDVPEAQHFPNVLENRYHIPRDRTAEAIKLIIENGKFAGVLVDQGEDRFQIQLDPAILPVTKSPSSGFEEESVEVDPENFTSQPGDGDWATICFFITPIGDEGTEQRRHADMMLKHVVEPAAKEHGLEVIRADKIERSGLITQQVFEQLIRARVCVADLSFTNANVFYELGVRHTCKLPSVQLIRKGDKIPFDVAQGRTITIDTTDIYSIADRLSSAQRELSQHLKHIMSSDRSEPGEDNPVHLYLPKLTVKI